MRWMDPNTQRGYISSLKKRKAGYIVRPKCFISHSQCLVHTILLFLSTLKSILNMSQLVLLSSLSVLPQKAWTTNKEATHVPHAGTCTDPFLLTSPSTRMCGFMAPLQLSKENHYRADYFLQGCDRGVCEILLACKYQLKIKKENYALTSPSGIHFRSCWIMPKCK